MRALTEEVYSMTRAEKLALLDALRDALLNEDDPQALEEWPIEELDRRCREVDEGKAKPLPLKEAMVEVRRMFSKGK